MDTADVEIERDLWNILKDRSENEVGRTVRIAIHAENTIAGVHKHRVTDIVKAWRNRGLVATSNNGARAVLTTLGATIDDPTSV